MRRDRHGRGSREIYARQGFEADFLDAVEQVRSAWPTPLRQVVFTIEEIPSESELNHDIKLGKSTVNRVTIYRRPIELRALSHQETRQLIFDTVVEQVAEILGIEPSDVHDDYGAAD